MNPPGREESEGHSDYNSAQTLIRRSVKDAVGDFVTKMFDQLIATGQTPSGLLLPDAFEALR